MSNDTFDNLIHTNSSAADVFTSVKKFQQLHEERVHAYHLFNEAHKIYLGTAPHYEFDRFRLLVQRVTRELKRVWDESVAVQVRLRNMHNGADKLADHIAGIQEAEKHKLELTAQFQMARQEVVDHPEETEREIKVQQLKTRLHHVVARIDGHLDALNREVADL